MFPLNAHDFHDFPQTTCKLDSGINAPFLLKEHGQTPTFYFLISMRTMSLLTEKISAEIYGYFFGK